MHFESTTVIGMYTNDSLVEEGPFLLSDVDLDGVVALLHLHVPAARGQAVRVAGTDIASAQKKRNENIATKR